MEGDSLAYKGEADYLIGTRYYLQQAGGQLMGGSARRVRAAVKSDRAAAGRRPGMEAAADAVDRFASVLEESARRMRELLARASDRSRSMGPLRANRAKVETEATSLAFRCWQAARALASALEEAIPDAEERKEALPATLDALAAFLDEAALLAPADEFAAHSSEGRAARLAAWDFRSCTSFTELAQATGIASEGVTVKAYAAQAARDFAVPHALRRLEAGAAPDEALVEEAVEAACDEGAAYMAADLADRARERFEEGPALRELVARTIPRVAANTCSKETYAKHVRAAVEAAVEARA